MILTGESQWGEKSFELLFLLVRPKPRNYKNDFFSGK